MPHSPLSVPRIYCKSSWKMEREGGDREKEVFESGKLKIESKTEGKNGGKLDRVKIWGKHK